MIDEFDIGKTVTFSQLTWCILLASVALSGCQSAAEHQASLPASKDRQVTVGTVQREIRIGMNQGEVASVLGSPNIVSREKDGTETWIYDKFATETAFSRSSGGVNALVLGGGTVGGEGFAGGGVGGYYGSSAGAASQTQRTLTVILKFKNNLLTDFNYHASRF